MSTEFLVLLVELVIGLVSGIWIGLSREDDPSISEKKKLLSIGTAGLTMLMLVPIQASLPTALVATAVFASSFMISLTSVQALWHRVELDYKRSQWTHHR